MLILDKQRAVARIVALTEEKGRLAWGAGRQPATGGRSYRGIATYERRAAAPAVDGPSQHVAARRRNAFPRA